MERKVDTEDSFEVEDSHLVKDLRKQLNEALKAKKVFEEELGQYKSQLRERSVAEVLQSKGVNPKVAKFLPSDVDGDEAIGAWLEENADLFGVAPPSVPAVSEEARSEMSRANALTERAVSPDKAHDLEQQIANANTVEEINQALADFQKFQL